MGTLKTLFLVGYKNSGKTTLLERWIRLVKEAGQSVAVLKHHGHGGPIELPPGSTDTVRFFEQGADATLVAGDGAAHLLVNQEPSFHELKQLAAFNQPDVLFIEGYKNYPGNKVVLIKSHEDWESLQHLSGIQLVVGDVPPTQLPVISSREEEQQLDSWFTNWLEKEEFDETL